MSELMKRLYAMADSVSQSQYERDLAADAADEIERLQKRLEEETTQHLLQEIKTEATLDAVRFAVMLAGQSIVEAHGEDSAAYEAIQSVTKALEDGGEK